MRLGGKRHYLRSQLTGSPFHFESQTSNLCLFIIIIIVIIDTLRIEPSASHMLGKGSTSELHARVRRKLFPFASPPETIIVPFGPYHATEDVWRVILFPGPLVHGIVAVHNIWVGRPYIAAQTIHRDFLIDGYEQSTPSLATLIRKPDGWPHLSDTRRKGV